jgi:AraC-like DNA-binding protein
MHLQVGCSGCKGISSPFLQIVQLQKPSENPWQLFFFIPSAGFMLLSKRCELCNLFQKLYNTFQHKKVQLQLFYTYQFKKEIDLKIYIKFMVSNRCKLAVKEELRKLGLHFIVVDLGEVEIMENISAGQREQLKMALLNSGLELMDDKRAVLIEKIKNAIIEMVHHTDDLIKTNFSDFLSEKLNHDYTYLANLFSEVQGTTIGQFILSHKIERIKELIIYDELNITEIAWKMNYSSVAHLSNQFKKATGLTPSHFKQLKDKRRSPIEEIGSLPVAIGTNGIN